MSSPVPLPFQSPVPRALTWLTSSLPGEPGQSFLAMSSCDRASSAGRLAGVVPLSAGIPWPSPLLPAGRSLRALRLFLCSLRGSGAGRLPSPASSCSPFSSSDVASPICSLSSAFSRHRLNIAFLGTQGTMKGRQRPDAEYPLKPLLLACSSTQGSCLIWETEEKPASSSCTFSSLSSSSARAPCSSTEDAMLPSMVLSGPSLSLGVWELL